VSFAQDQDFSSAPLVVKFVSVSSNDERPRSARVEADTMAAIDILVPREEVVYLKAVLEAYPGLAGVHAESGRQRSDEVPLTLVTTRALARELDEVLTELAREMPLRRRFPVAVAAEAIEACEGT
jgi:hypothetical protein